MALTPDHHYHLTPDPAPLLMDPDVYAERARRARPAYGTDEYEEWAKDNPMWFKDKNWGEWRHVHQVAPMGVFLDQVTGRTHQGAPVGTPLGQALGAYSYVIPGNRPNNWTIIHSLPAGVINPLWDMEKKTDRITQIAQFEDGATALIQGDFDLGKPNVPFVDPDDPPPPLPPVGEPLPPGSPGGGPIDEFHSELPPRRRWRPRRPPAPYTDPRAEMTI